MSKTILAGIAVFVLLAAIISIPTTHYVDAATTKDKAKTPAKATTKTTTKTTKTTKTPAKTTKAPAKTSEVTIQIAKGSSNEGCDKGNKCYSPYEAKVSVGGTVTWVNKDTATHTATSGIIANGPDGKFDTGLISAGGKFSQKFDTAGSYDYFCMIHPWMKGKVTVS